MKKHDHTKIWLAVLALISLSVGCVTQQSKPNQENSKPSAQATRLLRDQARQFSPQTSTPESAPPRLIVLRKAETVTVLSCTTDKCEKKPTASDVTAPLTLLTSRLKAALYVPTDMPPEMKERIDLFEKGDRDDLTTMKVRVEEFNRVIADLQSFISASQPKATRAKSKLATAQKKLVSLKKKVAGFSGKLADIPTLGAWVRELNQTSESVVDTILSEKNLDFTPSSARCTTSFLLYGIKPMFL